MIPIIAHRTCPRDAPENSLAGIRKAAELGADGVEIDVRRSLDGVAVLMHDWSPRRTTGLPGPVRLYPSFLLRRVRLRGPGDGHVPTLAEALDALPEGLFMAVEIKDGDSDTRVDVEADPEATTKNSMFVQAPSLLDVLEQILAAQGGGNPVEKFGETSVSGNTETTLASYTVPAGKKVQVRGIFGEGVDNGVFRLYIDGTKVWQKRNAWTDRNVEGAMFAEATASQAIEVKVLNLMPVARDFSGGFFGIEL